MLRGNGFGNVSGDTTQRHSKSASNHLGTITVVRSSVRIGNGRLAESRL